VLSEDGTVPCPQIFFILALKSSVLAHFG